MSDKNILQNIKLTSCKLIVNSLFYIAKGDDGAQTISGNVQSTNETVQSFKSPNSVEYAEGATENRDKETERGTKKKVGIVRGSIRDQHRGNVTETMYQVG